MSPHDREQNKALKQAVSDALARKRAQAPAATEAKQQAAAVAIARATRLSALIQKQLHARQMTPEAFAQKLAVEQDLADAIIDGTFPYSAIKAFTLCEIAQALTMDVQVIVQQLADPAFNKLNCD